MNFGAGPTPVVLRGGRLEDASGSEPTVSELLARWPDVPEGRRLGGPEELPFGKAWDTPERDVRLLAPIDLQCVKAAGVTFAVSALERVIEERARGDATKAQNIRDALKARVGADL